MYMGTGEAMATGQGMKKKHPSPPARAGAQRRGRPGPGGKRDAMPQAAHGGIQGQDAQGGPSHPSSPTLPG